MESFATKVLWCTVVQCAVLYCTVLYCTVLYSTLLYSYLFVISPRYAPPPLLTLFFTTSLFMNVTGRHVFMGYMYMPDKSAETIDEDGTYPLLPLSLYLSLFIQFNFFICSFFLLFSFLCYHSPNLCPFPFFHFCFPLHQRFNLPL